MCETFSRQKTHLLYRFFARSFDSGVSLGSRILGYILPINVPKSYKGKICVFDKNYTNLWDYFNMEPRLDQFFADFVEVMNMLIQKKHIHAETFIAVKISWKTRNGNIQTAIEGYSLAFSSADLGHSFESNVGNEIGLLLRQIGAQKLVFANEIVR